MNNLNTRDSENESRSRTMEFSFIRKIWNIITRSKAPIIPNIESSTTPPDMTAEEIIISWKPGQSDKEDYEVFTMERIMEYRANTITDVASVTQMPNTYAQFLLNHFRWDKQELMEKFHSRPQEKIFKDAKNILPRQPIAPKANFSIGTLTSFEEKQTTMNCQLCFLNMPTKMMTGLECGHLFCIICWTEYVTIKVRDEGLSESIECPGNCNVLLDDEEVMKLIVDANVKVRYQNLIANSFVRCNRFMRWCSAPGCNYAVKVLKDETKPVKCKCGHVFCFGCAEDWHDPVECSLMKKWMKKCNDYEEKSIDWIASHTKECPNCSAIVEKNGGCSRVICLNKNCRAEYCWQCLESTETHSTGHFCKEADKPSQIKSRAALEKYSRYFKHYAYHNHALKYENQLYEVIRKQVKNHDEAEFVKEAANILCECRRTLTFTYVYAYYKNDENELFKIYLADLKQSTEDLSEYLNRYDGPRKLGNWHRDVVDASTLCENRRNVLLDHIRKDYEFTINVIKN